MCYLEPLTSQKLFSATSHQKGSTKSTFINNAITVKDFWKLKREEPAAHLQIDLVEINTMVTFQKHV